jgi:hypothetical protein
LSTGAAKGDDKPLAGEKRKKKPARARLIPGAAVAAFAVTRARQIALAQISGVPAINLDACS